MGVILKRDVQARAGKERCQTMMDQERSIYNEGALGCPEALSGFAEMTVRSIGAQRSQLFLHSDAQGFGLVGESVELNLVLF
ncbi:MAG: hypothetical protein AMXMBFR67_22580 [Nitrospira sp.]